MSKLTTFCVVGNQVGNYLDTIFRIILDWKSAKSSVTYYKTSDVDGMDYISAFLQYYIVQKTFPGRIHVRLII